MITRFKSIYIFFKHELKQYKKTIGQTGLLFFSNISAILIGFPIVSLQTRMLGPDLYGIFAFYLSLTGFTVLFFRFGFFSSVKVLLANNNNVINEREYYGAGIFIGVIIGISYSVFLFVLSFFIDKIFNIEFGLILKIISPLCCVLPMQFLIIAFSIGSNNIKANAFLNIFSKLFYLFFIILVYFFDYQSLFKIIILNLFSVIFSVLLIFKQFNPLFSNLKLRVQEIYKANLKFGRLMYIGAVLDQTTYKLDGICISYFSNVVDLGFYNLASVICSPISILSKSLSNTLFKKMSLKDKVDNKIFIYNTIWCISSFIILLSISGFLINTIFGEGFSKVAVYILPLGLANLLNGLESPANSFLSVKQKGKWMMKNSLNMTVVNLIGNFTLIPFFGAIGAAWASVVSMLIFCVSCFYYYKLTVLKVL